MPVLLCLLIPLSNSFPGQIPKRNPYDLLPYSRCHLSMSTDNHVQSTKWPSFSIVDANFQCLCYVSSMIASAKMQQSVFSLATLSITPAMFSSINFEELNRLESSFFDSNPLTRRKFIAKDRTDDSIIGYLDIDRTEFEDPEQYPIPYISDIVVAPRWRRKGVGRALLKRCEDLCMNDWQEKCLHLWVETDNAAALSLYRAVGYVPIRGEVVHPNDEQDTVRSSIISRFRFMDPRVQEDCWGDIITDYDRVLLQKIISHNPPIKPALPQGDTLKSQ